MRPTIIAIAESASIERLIPDPPVFGTPGMVGAGPPAAAETSTLPAVDPRLPLMVTPVRVVMAFPEADVAEKSPGETLSRIVPPEGAVDAISHVMARDTVLRAGILSGLAKETVFDPSLSVPSPVLRGAARFERLRTRQSPTEEAFIPPAKEIESGNDLNCAFEESREELSNTNPSSESCEPGRTTGVALRVTSSASPEVPGVVVLVLVPVWAKALLADTIKNRLHKPRIDFFITRVCNE